MMDNKELLISELIKRIESLESKRGSGNEHTNDIAIIGMNCLFPGESNSLEKYWENLISGFDGITSVPDDRVYLNELRNGKKVVDKGGFINHSVSGFDADFFDTDHQDANYIDPQHRILLETAYNAIETAGIKPKSLIGTNTGVYIGVATSDYQTLIAKYSAETNENMAKGISASSAAGRIAYALKTEGPTLTVNTACSSALVALHIAAQALRNNEIDLAIVGGVNLLLSPDNFEVFEKEGVLSPESKCKVFDQSADGYVRGEGCGIVILKRLNDALAEHNNIDALIKGSAINQNGGSSAYTVPRVNAQTAVIKKALKMANISENEISYIELGSAGTKLGDQIEGDALVAAFNHVKFAQPLLLGSVKTNIGHLEAASGMASLIKTVLALKNKYIPAHKNFNSLNSSLNLSEIPAKIAAINQEWILAESQQKRYAGVSSFGFTGANAHLILQEAPVMVSPSVMLPESELHLILFSAKTQSSLEKYLHEFSNFLSKQKEKTNLFQEIVYKQNVSKDHFSVRVAVLASSIEDLKQKITNRNFVEKDSDFAKGNLDNDYPTIENNRELILSKLAQHYLNGNEINFNKLKEYYFAKTPTFATNVSVPSYCFEETYFWFPANASRENVTADFHYPCIRSAEIICDSSILINYNIDLVSNKEDFLPYDCIEALLETIEIIQENLFVSLPIHFEKINFVSNEIMTKEQRLQAIAKKDNDGHNLRLYSNMNNVWKPMIEASLAEYHLPKGIDYIEIEKLAIDELSAECNVPVELSDFNNYIQSIGRSDNAIFCQINLSEQASNYCVPPVCLEIGYFLINTLLAKNESFTPLSCSSIDYFYTASPEYLYIKIDENENDIASADLILIDKQGRVKLKISRLMLGKQTALQTHFKYPLYTTKWETINKTELNDNVEGKYFIFDKSNQIGKSINHPKIVITNNILEANTVVCLIRNSDYIEETKTLLKEIAQGIKLQAPKLIIVSEKMAPIDNQQPRVSAALGIYKSLLIESPKMKVSFVDVENIEKDINEALSYQKEDILAYRNGQFYCYRISPLTSDVLSVNVSLKQESDYIIAGEISSSAIELAKFMIQKEVNHLYIITTSNSSESKWLNDQKSKISFIKVEHVSHNAIADAFKSISEKNLIKGIFLFTDNNNQEDSFESFIEKTTYAFSLYQCSNDLALQLDYFVLISLLNDSLGMTYNLNAATGAFIEQLANIGRFARKPLLNITWSLADNFPYNEAFTTLLSQNASPLLLNAAQISLPTLNKNIYWLDKIYPQHKETPKILQLLEQTSPENREQVLKDRLIEIIRQIMNAPDMTIDMDKGFFDLGMTSLNAVDAKDLLQKEIGDDYYLRNSLFFERSTLNSLHDWLVTVCLSDYFQISAKRYEQMTNEQMIEMASKFIKKDE
jgi:3-oxoacyl-(acyl-carrier-protein) synthase